MRKVVIAFAAAAVLTLASAASVLAASPNHINGGTPGAANCHGQSTAGAAQKYGGNGFHGIGGNTRLNGGTVQDTQAAIDAFCASGD